MKSANELQQRLFKEIKAKLPTHLSLVDEISDLLGISSDSAYRRIRGEKQLLIQELMTVCKRFHISFDALINLSQDSILFKHIGVKKQHFSVNDYLSFILARGKAINASPKVDMIMITNDINIFQLLQFPVLSAFKFFFWQKSSLGFEHLKHKKFTLDEVTSNLIEKGKEIVHEYIKIPTTEVIGVQGIESFLRQIMYYLEVGYFQKNVDSLLILDNILELIQHFQQEAELRYKFTHRSLSNSKGGLYTLYYNELFVIDGLVLVKIEDTYQTYIASGPMDVVYTQNQQLYETKLQWAKTIMQGSILLSGIAEKERRKFFSNMEDQIKHTQRKYTNPGRNISLNGSLVQNSPFP